MMDREAAAEYARLCILEEEAFFLREQRYSFTNPFRMCNIRHEDVKRDESQLPIVYSTDDGLGELKLEDQCIEQHFGCAHHLEKILKHCLSKMSIVLSTYDQDISKEVEEITSLSSSQTAIDNYVRKSRIGTSMERKRMELPAHAQIGGLPIKERMLQDTKPYLQQFAQNGKELEVIRLAILQKIDDALVTIEEQSAELRPKVKEHL